MKTQTQRKTAARIASVVKLGASRQVVIPKRIHDRLGLRAGDYLEVELNDDKVVLTPKTLVEKRLAEALLDVNHRRLYGPFRSAKEMIRSLHAPEKRSVS
ncbi:MAG: AbrB/MazE/SpoVT family DNA-binding domain-containing protein [Candidatus Binataceae bacterium]